MKSFLLESKVCSVLITSEDRVLKELILIDDAPESIIKYKKLSCSLGEFPLSEVVMDLQDYFSGKVTDLDFDCDFGGYTPLEQKILNVVKGIPYGMTLTYEGVAEIIGNKNLRRAVGRTVAKNRYPLIVPCHRVLGKGGRLTGFSAGGGVKLKAALLKHENAL